MAIGGLLRQGAAQEDPQYAGMKIGGSAVEGAVPLVEVIYDGPGGDVKHPNTDKIMTPGLPYQAALVGEKTAGEKTKGPLRDEFARWAVSAENEYFAKSYVNRVWSYLLGVGFIEPVDDIRAGNPPTNPELLERLTKDFIADGFDTQKLIRAICKSRVYQHALATNRWNEDDAINYSHALARRLPAEVLYDAVHQATGSTRKLSGLPAGSRAAMQRDPTTNSPDGFLDLFGRPARESSCECERVGGVMLGQTLNLVTGPTIAAAIADPGSSLTKLIADEKDDRKLVEELFLRFLNRYPTDKELVKAVAALHPVDDGHERLVAELRAYEAGLPEKQAAWEKTYGPTVWSAPLELVEGKSKAGAKFEKEADGAIFVAGPLEKDLYTLTFDVDAARATGLRIEALPDDRLPGKGPGRAPNGNFVLSELTASIAPLDVAGQSRAVETVRGRSRFRAKKLSRQKRDRRERRQRLGRVRRIRQAPRRRFRNRRVVAGDLVGQSPFQRHDVVSISGRQTRFGKIPPRLGDRPGQAAFERRQSRVDRSVENSRGGTECDATRGDRDGVPRRRRRIAALRERVDASAKATADPRLMARKTWSGR
ncbi:MAG: DUF1553 domain-containing protein [Pirellulales bacterium]